jgi:mannopine transport system permease protein
LNWPFAGALAGLLLAATLCLVAAFRRVLSFGNAA